MLFRNLFRKIKKRDLKEKEIPDITKCNLKWEQIPGIKKAVLIEMKSHHLDCTNVISFQEKIGQIEAEGYTQFIFDMLACGYLNDTGLGTFVNIAEATENRGGAFLLVKIHPKVKVVFDMLGLSAFFKMFQTKEDAIKYLVSPESFKKSKRSQLWTRK